MNLSGIQVGDMIELDKKGRRFTARVDTIGDGEVTFTPCNLRESYRFASSREVVAHWRLMGRPRQAKAKP